MRGTVNRQRGLVLVEATPRAAIRVAIVENHELVAASLALLLDSQPDMEVVTRARSVREAALMPAGATPDVVVMDFHLDDGTGRDAALAIRERHRSARFVFLSRDTSDTARLAAIEAGAAAYVDKSAPASELIHAVRVVAAGETLITPNAVAETLRRGKDREAVRRSLTDRERDVLQLISDGVPTREVALRLGISYSTVRTHVRSINNKLGARSTLRAVVAARDLEIVS